jgi:hypothetical protein
MIVTAPKDATSGVVLASVTVAVLPAAGATTLTVNVLKVRPAAPSVAGVLAGVYTDATLLVPFNDQVPRALGAGKVAIVVPDAVTEYAPAVWVSSDVASASVASTCPTCTVRSMVAPAIA